MQAQPHGFLNINRHRALRTQPSKRHRAQNMLEVSSRTPAKHSNSTLRAQSHVPIITDTCKYHNIHHARIEHHPQNLTCLPHAQSLIAYPIHILTCHQSTQWLASQLMLSLCRLVCGSWYRQAPRLTYQQCSNSTSDPLMSILWHKHQVKFSRELITVITLELNIFSKIPMLILFVTSSAFYRYLSLARQVPGVPARTVADTQTHTQT